jgi:hypothetical protein
MGTCNIDDKRRLEVAVTFPLLAIRSYDPLAIQTLSLPEHIYYNEKRDDIVVI